MGKESWREVIHPASNRSKSDFVTQVNDALSLVLQIIYERQRILYENHSPF